MNATLTARAAATLRTVLRHGGAINALGELPDRATATGSVTTTRFIGAFSAADAEVLLAAGLIYRLGDRLIATPAGRAELAA